MLLKGKDTWPTPTIDTDLSRRLEFGFLVYMDAPSKIHICNLPGFSITRTGC